MFRSEDLLFQIFSNPNIPSHQNKPSQDLFSDHNNNYIYTYPPLDATSDHLHGHHYTATATANATSSRKRLQRDEVLPTTATATTATATATATTANDNNKLKRIMHREIERQRRQEMATLYASLRSLLPVEYVKGKRSTSDHMHEALNYIKHMQKSIQELGRKRDRLKTTTSGSQDSEKNGRLDKKIVTAGSRDFVSVSRCRSGIEVLIGFDGGGRGRFPLSRVLRTLENGGFDVVSCDSTTVDNRLLHRLQAEVHIRMFASSPVDMWLYIMHPSCARIGNTSNLEVSDEEDINLQALQQKLTDVINL
ncbi:unnamed protein product [Cuscuta epithymum]|uniref:BHLH domain-containing protein n=1 Tax=Cuscuta epithymum TaxID=186058 RepID=A0AAV0FVN1_9ASTE|nr:unnamed protein product [Cuscuta epithymum]